MYERGGRTTGLYRTLRRVFGWNLRGNPAMTPTYIYGFADALFELALHEPAPDVPEALVQDIWRNQRFRSASLTSFGGMPIAVLDPGELNSDTGPDFLGARIRLGSTTWTGAVEIHTSSGGWQDHGHHTDPRYNSTLLHVVLYHDMWTGRLHRADGTLLPELVLFPHLDAPLRRLIHSFYTRREGRILCASGWCRVPDTYRRPYLESLAHERVLSKAQRFRVGDPETNLYEAMFAGLGYAKNTAAMRTLARIVPLESVRILSDALDVEALYFGASGLLPAPADLLDADRGTADYVIELRDRFERLNHQFEVDPMPPTAWRFFRLRPANFPSLRIAQGAALLAPPDGLLRKEPLHRLLDASAAEKPIRALSSLFDVQLDAFWHDHVRLRRRTAKRSPAIGRQRINALLLNVVIPCLLALDADVLQERAFKLLARLPAADDEVTRQFSRLGTHAASALDSQGLHQLFRTRCSEARCLTCDIGRRLLDLDAQSL